MEVANEVEIGTCIQILAVSLLAKLEEQVPIANAVLNRMAGLISDGISANLEEIATCTAQLQLVLSPMGKSQCMSLIVTLLADPGASCLEDVVS